MSILKNIHNGRYNSRRRSQGWQNYQKSLNTARRRKKRIEWLAGVVIACIVLTAIYLGITSRSAATIPTAVLPNTPSEQAANHDAYLSKSDVRLLLSNAEINNIGSESRKLRLDQHHFDVQTSIDGNLQKHLMDAMDRRNSRYIAIVVMDPLTGRIMAMAGFNKIRPDNNPCLSSGFPAASIFKIVTAAAAVERCGLTPGTPMSYNGDKYTLYKSQLKETKNRWTRTLSFKDSFAQSVNPVFGKLGMRSLQKTILEQYGDAFGFNRPIEFELPVEPSRLKLKEKPYHWAEIASGFNNETTLSPVHAAMMVSAVLNRGEMIQPTVIDRIVDDQGTLLYQTRSEHCGHAMTDDTAEALTKLMEATVKSGTARGTFRTRSRDGVFSDLMVGGKTGSIFNRSHDVRFDWFVGFASEKSGAGQIVIASMVGHEKYIGIRAATYARMTIEYYFNEGAAEYAIRKKSG